MKRFLDRSKNQNAFYLWNLYKIAGPAPRPGAGTSTRYNRVLGRKSGQALEQVFCPGNHVLCGAEGAAGNKSGF